jgi:5'-deoxynucleotidase YfbR-like HD superfamily hydrolase
VLLLASHFPALNRARCLELAIIHDKLEIVTGDKNPVGRDGTGGKTHAFNAGAGAKKVQGERLALSRYLTRIRSDARHEQRELFEELLKGISAESRFVRAVDKLQAFAFVLLKKRGNLQEKHLRFTLRYTARAVEHFPGLAPHYEELRSRFLYQVARRRQSSVASLEGILVSRQLTFDFTGD